MVSVSYQLASLAIQCATNDGELCGANGLPITPSSIAMIGNFRSFIDTNGLHSGQKCPHLTHYLDCIRNKKEKVTLIFEHYSNRLPTDDMELMATHCLQALHYLHYTMGCVHGMITPEALVFDGKVVKLTHWPLNAVTECGRHCDASIILPADTRFLPLEQLSGIATVRKSDVWSLALTLLSFMDKNMKLPQKASEILSSVNSKEVLIKLEANLSILPEKWQKFFLAALQPKPSERATVKELMKILEIAVPPVECYQLNEFLRYPKLDSNYSDKDLMSIQEFYYLYCVAFPSIRDQNQEKRHKKPPILSLPTLIQREEQSSSGQNSVQKRKFVRIPANHELKLLSTEKLIERINQLPPQLFCPLILTPGFNAVWNTPNLPIVIRENDFDYQCERIMIFKRLIEGSPFTRPQLLSCAKIDIPPLYRSQIWAHILNIKWSDLLLYEQIDKITATQTDRQISVDIPRCHQYNDLLASPQGHQKLTRVLKAWLRHNESKGDVYWQGLDSLAAPFVIINFNNEGQAFACFNAFVHKYLKGFFQRDNSYVIQEYLALFSVLIKFQDPVLANHLNGLQFQPDLFAIPWFLTMFTHVLPLHQIMNLWDTLLLGNESFPLFIGLSVLNQLRDQLLSFTFNDCILIFSDLPQIDINKCVKHAIKQFCATPKTVAQRSLWPLDQLKTQNIPLIDISDVISLVKNDKISKVVVIDGRTKDQIQRFGAIRDAIVREHYEIVTSGHIVIVVNDPNICEELIANNCLRVCLLQLPDVVPKELLA